MTTFELNITAEDIAQDCHDGGRCPVARALHRVCKVPFHVQRDYVVFYSAHATNVAQGPDWRTRIGQVKLPAVLHNFICAYDDPKTSKTVKPFSFTWSLHFPKAGL